MRPIADNFCRRLDGCDIAADAESQDFDQQLAELSSADFAASVDSGGSAALGDD